MVNTVLKKNSKRSKTVKKDQKSSRKKVQNGQKQLYKKMFKNKTKTIQHNDITVTSGKNGQKLPKAFKNSTK